jgi:dipeptidyl aminopeptidase/acylaminoacyl peptidase
MEALIWSDYGSYWGAEMEAWPWEDPALFDRLSPLTYAKDIRTPVLVIQSLADHRTPPDQGERMYVTLRVLGKEAEMVLFPGSGHDLSRNGPPRQRIERLRVLSEWFARKVKGT